MDESLNHDEWLTVADAARLLMVSRNDMHLIPGRRRLWQTWCYKRSDITKWATQDLDSPTSILRRLREKKAAATQKLRKRANPYTKTGKPKKSLRHTLPQNCPQCGAVLSYDRNANDDGYEEFGEADDEPSPRPDEIRGGVRVIPVERKGRKGVISYSVTLDMDQEKRKAELIRQAAKSRGRKQWLVPVSLPYCPECGVILDDDYWDAVEPQTQDDDDHLSLIDDDVRAMTTSLFSMETGSPAGDIPDDDPSNGKS